MNKKYIVKLTESERKALLKIVSIGKGAAFKIKHANILLKLDANGPNWSDERAAEVFGCHVNTPRNIRQRLVEKGLEAALERKKRSSPPRKTILDGAQQARLTALCCSKPPSGRKRWTLKLLAEKLVALDIVEEISDQTVRRTLKKMHFDHTSANVG